MPALSNPRHDSRFLKYQTILLSRIDVTVQKGLEIGAFDLPFVTRTMGLVEFADQFTTSDLKDKAERMRGHSPDFVEIVDYVLTARHCRAWHLITNGLQRRTWWSMPPISSAGSRSLAIACVGAVRFSV